MAACTFCPACSTIGTNSQELALGWLFDLGTWPWHSCHMHGQNVLSQPLPVLVTEGEHVSWVLTDWVLLTHQSFPLWQPESGFEKHRLLPQLYPLSPAMPGMQLAGTGRGKGQPASPGGWRACSQGGRGPPCVFPSPPQVLPALGSSSTAHISGAAPAQEQCFCPRDHA